ncbi:MAG: HAMP domain-containing protein [Acidimicrobiales bacterium]
MPFKHRLLWLASRASARLPRRTVRLRLTMVYSSLFLASGALLLFVTNVLVRRADSGDNGFIVTRTGGGQAVFSFAGTVQGPPGPVAQFAANPGVTPTQILSQAQRAKVQLVSEHTHLVHQLALYSWAALAVVAALAVLFGWLMAGRVLRPLRTMTAAARNLSVTNLHQRLVLDGPDDELKDLGETFNALLGRLETAFTAQRRFVANASHELRSPLARQRTLAQVALPIPTPTSAASGKPMSGCWSPAPSRSGSSRAS